MKKKIFFSLFIILIMIPTILFAFVEYDPIAEPPEGGISDTVSLILGAIQYAGLAIAVGMIIYIGIKYMMSSANEKAELKQTSINYVIGLIVIVIAYTICVWIVNFYGEAKGGGGVGGGGGANPTPSSAIDWQNPI